MKKIKLICDSSCDLTTEELKDLNVEVAPFLVSIDGVHYDKEDNEFDTNEFYNKMHDNPKLRPKTACPVMGDYLNLFEKYVKDDYSVICLCLTSKFSGSYNSALNAKEILNDEYKNTNIAVIDSELITVAQGLLVKQVVQMIENGLNFEKVLENIEKIKKTGKIFFTIGSMDYLNRGGRIGKVALVLASRVQIRPIIYFNEGDISAKGIAIGRKRSIVKVIEKIKKYFSDSEHNIEDYELAVGYGKDYEEGLSFLKIIQDFVNSITDKVKVTIRQIGATIAVHTGPLPLGLGFIKKYN